MTAAFDRGPAKYFHGRKQILRNFSELVARATQAESGTTFLIQGAPGAGKTALLAKCEELARDTGWKIADIDPLALWNPDELQQSLESKKKFKVEGGSAGVTIPGIGHAEISAGVLPQTVKTLLQKGEDPLLLTLDEAQVLGMEDEFPADQIKTVRHVLNSIHNGKLDRPVILIAAGLGTTVESFRSFGISRFAEGCLVELGALDREAERAVLRDWLKEDGEAKENPTAWIETIIQETHGWPQHILTYVKPALDQLHADKGVLTAEGLNAVLKAGRTGRAAYYKQRAHGFPEEERQSLARPFSDIPIGESVQLSKIMSSLTQDYSQDKAETLFRRAVERGIIDERSGRYVIPVPSMHDWLVSNYAREQIKFPPETPPVRSLEGRSSSKDFRR